MGRVHRLLVGTSVFLLPALAIAAPPEQVPTQQPTTLQPDAPPAQPAPPPPAPNAGGQTQGPGSQGQTLPAPGQGGPSINFQPQIQVQVNPQVDVVAKPQADAGADADADANATANPNANATSDIDASVDQDAKIDASGHGQGTGTGTGSGTSPGTGSGGGQNGNPTIVRKTKIVRHYEVPPPPEPEPFKPNTKRRAGLMIAGHVMFGASYITAAFNGARIYDRCDENYEDPSSCRKFAKKLFIPVAGPFMAIQDTSRKTNQVKLGINGGLQSAGALMMVIGTAIFIRDGYRNRLLNEHGIRVAKGTYLNPANTAGGGGVSLTHRF